MEKHQVAGRGMALALLAVFGAAFVNAAEIEPTDRVLVDWEFSRPGEAWRAVAVPHDWAISGPFDKKHDLQVTAIVQDGEKRADEKSGRTGALPWIGKGEYRRRITLPPGVGWAALVFDGAMSEPKVYFDGRLVGEWKNGYNAFEVELPPEPGEHEIRVALENRPLSSRWYPGAGLFRPVRLRVGNAAGIRTWGVSLHSPDFKTVRVATECRGTVAKVVYTVRDGDGVLARVEAGQAPVDIHADFAPWSPETPKLYTLVTEAYNASGTRVDACTRRFGVRTLSYGADGFALNGERRKFKGVCLHHDLGPLGAAFDPDAFRRQITLLKEMGCDALRTSHNMPGEGQLEICDELGMMVMAESFDAWASAKVDNGYNLFFKDWWKRDLENLVRKCRSHPSVVMWSIGNEVNEQTVTEGAQISRELQEWCHRFDPDPARKVTQGLSWMPHAIKNGLNAVMEIPGVTYRLPFYDAMYKDTKAGLVLGAETASTVSSRGEYFFPVKVGQGVMHPNGQSSGYDVECCPWSNLPDDDWAMQEDKPWTIGEFVWTGFDYLGEPTPYNSYWPSRSSYFGIFDLAGLPKDRYWLYRSHWNPASPTLHLVPHWTFPGRNGKITPVYCYTNYDEAELFVNGKSQGRRRKNPASRLDRFRLRWNDVVYEPGELKVVAYGRDGRKLAEETVRTAGAPAGVRLEKRRFGRLLFVTASIVDAAGTLVPDAKDRLSFSARGNLCFRAVCNGDATSLELFHENSMAAFHGQLVAIFEGEGDDVSCTRSSENPYAACAHLSRPAEFDLRVREMELMKKNGIGWVRTDFDWKYVEPQQGCWKFDHLDRLLEDADRIGVKVLPILDYEVPFAYHPWEPAQLPLWRNYVRRIVSRYKDRCRVWEVWNEENCDQNNTHPFPNPEEYVRLLRAACEEIRAVDPNLRIAIGGFALVPLDYIEGVYKAGGRDFFDIMNVHPYQNTARAEGRMEREYLALRALMAKYGDADKPIWATELGLMTETSMLGETGFVKAALGKIAPGKSWRVLHVMQAAMPHRNVRPHNEAFREILKCELVGMQFEVCTFEACREQISSGRFDAVLMPFSEEYPADALDAIVDFVAQGGTVVELGGMPFFKPMVRGGDGVWRQQGDSWAMSRRLRFRASSSHLDKTLPRKAFCRAVTGFDYPNVLPGKGQTRNGWGEVRFFFPDSLKSGDSFIPLMTAKTADGRDVASAAWIKYGSDLKGNLVLAGYFERGVVPFDAEEQAIGCARQLNLAFALGYEKLFWYEFLQCSDFGIVSRKDFSPRPACLAYSAFIAARPAGSMQMQGKWKSADGDVYFPRWTRPDGTSAGAVWSVSGRGAPPSLPELAGKVRFADYLGRKLECLPAVLPDTPIYYSIEKEM